MNPTKLRFFSLVLIISLMLTACSDSDKHEGEAKTPSASSTQKGRNYQDVIDTFEEKGFININTEVLDDLITGWLTKDGEVESVSVDGNVDYTANVWYPNDVEIVITYHTFPLAKEEISSPEFSDKPNSQESEQLENQNENVNFPVEYAMRAAVVAFTNRYADDVFTNDGNNYDISKFHSYADISGFFMYITSEGTWSVKDENTWHVEHLKLKVNEYNTTIDATLDVRYDGENYTISNLFGTAPSYDDISDFEREDDFSLFFIVTPELIGDDRVAVKELREDVAKKAFETYGEYMYPYGFKCHWLTGTEEHEQSYDGSWYFKVSVTITNQYDASREATAEGFVNNTTESVEDFNVY